MMTAMLTYELHLLRGHDWIIDRVYESRDEALREARALIAANPQACVQLIEERFDPSSGHTQETVIFKAQPVDKGSATFRRRSPPTGPRPPARRGLRLPPETATLVFILIAYLAGLLTGLVRP
jgi:hypothetical protein